MNLERAIHKQKMEQFTNALQKDHRINIRQYVTMPALATRTKGAAIALLAMDASIINLRPYNS